MVKTGQTGAKALHPTRMSFLHFAEHSFRRIPTKNSMANRVRLLLHGKLDMPAVDETINIRACLFVYRIAKSETVRSGWLNTSSSCSPFKVPTLKDQSFYVENCSLFIDVRFWDHLTFGTATPISHTSMQIYGQRELQF